MREFRAAKSRRGKPGERQRGGHADRWRRGRGGDRQLDFPMRNAWMPLGVASSEVTARRHEQEVLRYDLSCDHLLTHSSSTH